MVTGYHSTAVLAVSHGSTGTSPVVPPARAVARAVALGSVVVCSGRLQPAEAGHYKQRRYALLVLTALCIAAAGCQRTPGPAPAQDLPPAYTSNQITDPGLRRSAEEIQHWAVKQAGTKGQPLFSRVELLAPVQTVQPYGVGAYQQEARLPVILTTGAGWAGLTREDKEAKVAEMFRALVTKLEALSRQPPLRPTLTIQTPEGMELAWINHLDPHGKNLHGED